MRVAHLATSLHPRVKFREVLSFYNGGRLRHRMKSRSPRYARFSSRFSRLGTKSSPPIGKKRPKGPLLRPIYMTSQRNMPKSKSWLDYHAAFENFSGKVRQLQTLAAQEKIDRAEMETSLLEVEHARLAYSGCRDALARELLRRSARDPSSLRRDVPDRTRVKAIAELFWDLTGRREGTMEDNWHRAESIVRRAAAFSACC